MKIVQASIAFIAVGVMVLVGTVPMIIINLQPEKNTSSAYPHWVYLSAWGCAFLVGLFWIGKGINGMLVHCSGIKEEKENWWMNFKNEESNLRGGSRMTIYILGGFAILFWLLFGIYMMNIN